VTYREMLVAYPSLGGAGREGECWNCSDDIKKEHQVGPLEKAPTALASAWASRLFRSGASLIAGAELSPARGETTLAASPVSKEEAAAE